MKYVSGKYTSGELLRNIRAIEDWISDYFEKNGPITDAVLQKDMDERVRDASFGKNAVLFDDAGNPSIMVRIPMGLLSELVAGWPENLHPAFIVNGLAKSEIWIGKYQGTTVTNDDTKTRAVSLRRKDPKVYIDFDSALTVCKDKGSGWHLMTNVEWAYIALWCKKNGFWPRGNNSYGNDYARTEEWGEVTHIYSGTTKGRVATGTGPAPWSHDGSPFGVFDLNGNVWEWVGGLRLKDGEIQILENNNAADSSKDQSASSLEWKAILQDGSLVDPGTADSLKFDSPNPLTDDGTTQDQGAQFLSTTVVNGDPTGGTWGDGCYDSNSVLFQELSAASGVTVPDLLKQLGVFPVDSDHGGDKFYLRNYGERLALRGGHWNDASYAGVFALYLNNARSDSLYSLGFRPAYIG